MTTGPEEVLGFWLDEIGPAGWYAGTGAIDAACRARFLPAWEALHGGRLEHWLSGSRPALAYLIVADQFSRNIHRGRAEAFATDARARAAARRALESGWDMEVPAPGRQFFYMPFEHSEDMRDQDRAVALMAERLASEPGHLLHARAHREMIRRFGRFPLRNAALGRENTPDEAAFIAAGGYGALVAQMEEAERAGRGPGPGAGGAAPA